MRRKTAIGLGILAFLATGLIGFGYSRYRSSAEPPPGDSTPIWVTVVNPGSGSDSPAGVPVPAEVWASGPDPMLEVELWAGDLVVGTQVAPTADGVTQLRGFFSWLPSVPGIHHLQARATSIDGTTEVSDPVWVFVRADGLSGEVLAGGGAPDPTVPAPSGGGAGDPPSAEEIAQMPAPVAPPPPFPPTADTPVTASEPWSPGLGGFLPWLFASGGPPVAPELIGAGDGCNVMLSLHDKSDDEMGFRLYRSEIGGDASPEPLLTLAAGPETGWLPISDVVDHGSIYTYVAEAFDAGGTSGPSATVTVNSFAAGCPAPEPPPLVSLVPTVLTTPQPVESVYCYVSSTGQIWSRFPEIGFLTVGEDGTLDHAGKVADVFTQVDGPEIQTPAENFWDCWGWTAGALIRVGWFSPDEEEGKIPTEMLQLELTGDGGGNPLVTAEGLPVPGGIALGVESIPVVTIPPAQSIVDIAGTVFEDLVGTIDPTVTDLQMLAPRLHYSTETSDCVNRLPGWVKPDFRIALCHPGDDVGPDSGDLGDHPHPYLFWDLADPDNCGDPGNCLDPRTESYLPYTVVDSGYHLYELTLNGEIPVKTFGFGEELFIVPPKGPCETLRVFEVRTFVALDGGFSYESQSPHAITLFAEPCAASVPVEIEVTFTTLSLGDIDDGIGDDDIEIYGTFSAIPTVGTGGSLLYGQPKDLINCLSNESLPAAWNIPGVDKFWSCPQLKENGDTNLGVAPSYFKCKGDHSKKCGQNVQKPGNNTVHVTTEQGNDSILVSVDLWDLDSASAHDPVCQASMWVTKDAGSPWSQMDGGTWFMYQGDNGNASCTVWLTFDVVAP